MRRKGITRKQSRLLLISSIVIFLVSEIIAEVLNIWLVNNLSVGSLLTYDRWLSVIPEALSVGASVFLAHGLAYYSRSSIALIIFGGVVLMTVSFVLIFMNVFNTTVEYYPGYYSTIPWPPLSSLFVIGIGIIIGAIMSLLLRDLITGRRRDVKSISI